MKQLLIMLIAVFALGYLASTAISELQPSLAEKPQVFTITETTNEKPSPSDWIKPSQIEIYDDKIIVNIEGATWASFADTNSMDPILDDTTTGIEVKPESADQINVGDVIAYRSQYGVIIHRVSEKGTDEQGVYFIAKGDNNSNPDPNKIRFTDIERVLVAVIY